MKQFFAATLSQFVMVTDAPDAVYVTQEDKRHILLNLGPGQGEREVSLRFLCSNSCCE